MLRGLLFAQGLVLLILGPCASSAQSPWTRSKAGFIAEANGLYFPVYGKVFYRGPSERPLDRELSQYTLEFYGEYGLNRKTTLIAALPLRLIHNGDRLPNFEMPETEAGSAFGLGNAALALRRSFSAGHIAFAGQFRLELPATKYYSAKGIRTGYAAFTLQPSLSIGQKTTMFYWFIHSGYGLRSGGYSHFFNTGGEAGFHFGKCWLAGFAEWQQSLGNGNILLPLKNRLTALFINDQEWISAGAKGTLILNRFVGLRLSASRALDGEWVPRRMSFGLGFYFKWD